MKTSFFPRRQLWIATLLGLASLAAGPVWCEAQQQTGFEIFLNPEVAEQPVSGRLFVFLSQRSSGDPMRGPSWFAPEPFFGLDVTDFAPGQNRTVDDRADGFPAKLSQLPAGEYQVQALLDHDFYFSSPANGPGNYYSDVATAMLNPAQPATIQLDLNRVVQPRESSDTQWVKYVDLQSSLLSGFHERPVVEQAAVVLPPSYYDQPDRRYPVYYVVSGFGGTLSSMAARYARGSQPPTGDGQVEFIRVLLAGQCKWGHHVYANSATNGPRGDALVKEMIPLIDRQFRTVAKPTARFVGGHSSGGWSSLWLQVNYPDTFGGVWSTSPDPVDFRDWQGTDLYAPAANMYFDAQGNRKPLARRGTTPVLWYKDFTDMDDVLARGGQIRSFDAVFSPLDERGQPARCWNRQTGTVDPAVVEHWKKYDISLMLLERWSQLGPKLKGKLHVIMGDRDTFYLEGATRLLGQRLAELSSDAQITIVPGADHGSVLTGDVRAGILREMSEEFLRHHAPDGD